MLASRLLITCLGANAGGTVCPPFRSPSHQVDEENPHGVGLRHRGNASELVAICMKSEEVSKMLERDGVPTTSLMDRKRPMGYGLPRYAAAKRRQRGVYYDGHLDRQDRVANLRLQGEKMEHAVSDEVKDLVLPVGRHPVGNHVEKDCPVGIDKEKERVVEKDCPLGIDKDKVSARWASSLS